MNTRQANVKSFQAINDLKGNIAVFRDNSQQTLDGIGREIDRIEEWIDERQRHWRREVERAQESRIQARCDLERQQERQATPDSRAYDEACRYLHHAETELNNVLHWRKVVNVAVANYRQQELRLEHHLQQRIPQAETFLKRKIIQLEAYRAGNPAMGSSVTATLSTAGSRINVPSCSSTELIAEQKQENIKKLLHKVAAENPTVQEKYQAYLQSLPQAIDLIIAVTPDALGLLKFSAYRDMKEGTILKSRLANRNKSVVGFLYELLGTAALISSPSSAVNGENQLVVHPEKDRIDFAIKFDPTELAGQRKSVEADLLLYRRIEEDGRWIDGSEIAIDFKHARQGKTYSGNADEFQREVQGIQNVLRTDQIHEFHFVTNGTFSKRFKQIVTGANTELFSEGRQNNLIFYHEGVIFGKQI